MSATRTRRIPCLENSVACMTMMADYASWLLIYARCRRVRFLFRGRDITRITVGVFTQLGTLEHVSKYEHHVME
jgi:hypothetical protein